MADISSLSGLTSAEPLDLDIYADAKESFQLPKKGRYVVRAPESFDGTAFGASKAGFLKATVDPTIVGPTNEGFQLRYTSVSAKPFQRGKVTVSQLGDYLRACALRGTVPGDPQGMADAVERTAGLTYQVDLDWRAYNKNTGFAVNGMDNFPKDANGEPLPYVIDEGDIDPDTQEPRRLRANVQVTRYVPAA